MCLDPITLLTIASTAVSAFASVRQGQAQAAANKYNAQIADRNAQAAADEQANVKDAAAIERRRLGQRVAAEKGGAIAKANAEGIDANFGTPVDLVGDLENAYRVDASILGKNEITNLGQLDKQIADYKDTAAQQRSAAKSATQQGYLGALGSVFSGGAQVASHWIQPPTSPVPTSPGMPDWSGKTLPSLPPVKSPVLIGAG